MANSLVAGAVDTTTPFSGAFLIEDGRMIAEAIKSGSWVDGGIAAFSTALDTIVMISDPIGTLLANGLGWVLDHVEPLKGWMNDFTGDAGAVMGFAQTWRNVATEMHNAGDSFTRRTQDLNEMSGETVDAYLRYAEDAAKHLKAQGDWADAIAQGMDFAAQIVQVVHDLVRDAISQIVGTAISIALEMALTVGLATPLAIEQITTKVSALATRVGMSITRLLASVRSLRTLLGNLMRHCNGFAGKVDGMLHTTPATAPAGKPSVPAPKNPPKPGPAPAAKPPKVRDPSLQNRLDAAYLRPNTTSKIPGDGSLVAAIKHELQTGEMVGGKSHAVNKAANVLNSLKKWLRLNPQADPGDIQAAKRLMKEINDALGG